MERRGEQEWGHRMFQALQFPKFESVEKRSLAIGQDPPTHTHTTALEASCQGTVATETGLALQLVNCDCFDSEGLLGC